MDGPRFDDLTKALASGSRRSLLKTGLGLLAGGALGGLARGNAAAAAKRAPGEICRKNGDCASNICGPKDQYGRQRCGCTSATQCPAARGACQVAACTNGVCGSAPAADGAPCVGSNLCLTGQTCTGGVCGGGTPRNCDDANPCTVDSCDPKVGCVNTPRTCDDSNACTVGSCDQQTGQCVLTPISCDDNNPCTTDTCDPQAGCVYTPVACNATDQCHTEGTCDSAQGCSNPEAPKGTACSDGNALCANGSCCPTNGYEVVHGGCFQINNTISPTACSSGCAGTAGDVDGSGNRLCVGFGGNTPCANTAACPTGEVCVGSSPTNRWCYPAC